MPIFSVSTDCSYSGYPGAGFSVKLELRGEQDGAKLTALTPICLVQLGGSPMWSIVSKSVQLVPEAIDATKLVGVRVVGDIVLAMTPTLPVPTPWGWGSLSSPAANFKTVQVTLAFSVDKSGVMSGAAKVVDGSAV